MGQRDNLYNPEDQAYRNWVDRLILVLHQIERRVQSLDLRVETKNEIEGLQIVVDQAGGTDANYMEFKRKAKEGNSDDLWSLAVHVLYKQPEKSKAIEAAKLIEHFDVDQVPKVKFQLAQLYLMTDDRQEGFAILEQLMEKNFPPAYCTVAAELMHGSTEYTGASARELLNKAKSLGSMRARYILSILNHKTSNILFKPVTFFIGVYWQYRFNRYWEDTDAADVEYL
ncbi:MAG: hypothetical protein ABJ018_21390 [Paracoccaceae bacterium]